VWHVPRDAVVVRCPQRVDRADERVAALAAAWDSGAARLRAKLALEPGDLPHWDTLSPGERKRWQVGAALAAEPEILLLDEPTNHLDGEARRLLLDALREHRGVGVVVSHDRSLLDELTTATIALRGTSAEMRRGGYSAARAEWDAEAVAQRDARAEAKRVRRTIEGRLRRARDDRAAAEAGIKRERRSARVADSDARSMERKGRVAGAERALGRSVEVLRGELARAERRQAAIAVPEELGGAVRFDHEPAPKRWLASLDLPVLRAGRHVLAEEVHLGIRRNDRIRVTGRNGAGKTTLLGALVACAAIPGDRILHLPQESTTEGGRALVASARALSNDARGRLMQLVALLGVDPERLLASDAPSPGEARKLAVAYGLATSAWLLVLDEPTNHLDLPSIERLEAALRSYPGALVIVTHDEAMARRLTETAWHVGDGEVTVTADA